MTREEQWLSGIKAAMNGDSPLPEVPAMPAWHYEEMLAAIYDVLTEAESPRPFPRRCWRLDEVIYAVYCALCGNDSVTPPTPTDRIEALWAGIYDVITGADAAEAPSPVWRIEEFLKAVYDASGNWGTEETLTGALVSFIGKASTRIRSLKVALAPMQDLHGYSAPWPAGGGKNLLKTAGLTYAAPSDTGYSNSLKRTFAADSYCDGLSSNNYFQRRASNIAVAENSISFTTPATAYGVNIPVTGLVSGQTYTLSASMTNGIVRFAFYKADGTWISEVTSGSSFTVPAETCYTVICFIAVTVNAPSSFTDIQLELGGAATAYAPYANVCPIIGHTGCTAYVAPTEDPDDGTAYAADWASDAGTVYGGTMDVVTGELKSAMANIASYAGETIREPWLSSMDEYAAGTAPTAGAQVVYPLAAPLTCQLTPQGVEALTGANNIWSDSGDVTVTVKGAADD